VGILTTKQHLRLTGILFLLAAVAFCFTPWWWVAAFEVAAGIAMLIASARTLPVRPPSARRPPRQRGRP
jgi:hypothetical protein